MRNLFYGVPNEFGVIPASPQKMRREADRILREHEEREYPRKTLRYEPRAYDPAEARNERQIEQICDNRGVCRWG